MGREDGKTRRAGDVVPFRSWLGPRKLTGATEAKCCATGLFLRKSRGERASSSSYSRRLLLSPTTKALGDSDWGGHPKAGEDPGPVGSSRHHRYVGPVATLRPSCQNSDEPHALLFCRKPFADAPTLVTVMAHRMAAPTWTAMRALPWATTARAALPARPTSATVSFSTQSVRHQSSSSAVDLAASEPVVVVQTEAAAPVVESVHPSVKLIREAPRLLTPEEVAGLFDHPQFRPQPKKPSDMSKWRACVFPLPTRMLRPGLDGFSVMQATT